MSSTSRTVAVSVLMILLASVPPLANSLHSEFLVGTITRVIIFGLAAVSLDFILGYAGLASFGPAAFFGLGGYVVAILGYHAFEGSSLFGLPIALSGTTRAMIAWRVAIVV